MPRFCRTSALALVSSLLVASVATEASAAYFGAIAFSQSTGARGYSYDYGSRYEAEERALQECGAGCTDHGECHSDATCSCSPG